MRTMQGSVLKRIDNLLARASSRASGAASASGIVTAGNGGVTLGPLDGTTTTPPTVIAAFDVTPTKGGLYQVSFTVGYVLSAADNLGFLVDAVPAVTAITGGAAAPPPNAAFHYETTGSPLVVTGGTPVLAISAAVAVATGQIAAQTQLITGTVQLLPTPTRQAIVLSVVTAGGAHLTTLAITNASAIEL